MLNEKLKMLRESKNLNKKQMAKELNIPYMTYCRYENGEREPNNDMLIKIAEYFQTSVDYLVGNTIRFDCYPHDLGNTIKCPICSNDKIGVSRCFGVDFNNSNSYGCAVEMKCSSGHTFYYVFESLNKKTYGIRFDSTTTTINPIGNDDILYDSGFSNVDFSDLDEIDFKRKYFELDPFGKKAVSVILDAEYERCENISKQPVFMFRKLSANKASAGTGFDLNNPDEWKEIEVVDTPEARQADFAVEVEGASMEPDYYDGDIVYISLASEIPVGQAGLFIQNGKGYIKEAGDGCIISRNPDYDDIFPADGDIECKGRVIGIAELP